jgi:hypothetical protein
MMVGATGAPMELIVKTVEQTELEVADALALEVARKELDAKLATESSTQINDPQVSLFLLSATSLVDVRSLVQVIFQTVYNTGECTQRVCGFSFRD